MNTILNIKNLNYYYGKIHAVKGIDLSIFEGEIVSIVGANGAGKSTTLNSIAGINNSLGLSGSIIYNGTEIIKKTGHEINKLGISIVIEGRHIFPQMSVYENLLLGGYLRRDSIDDDIESVCRLFPILKDRMNQNGGTLSGGEQQMLAISRALIAKPKLLLLDEPSLGLAPIVTKEIFKKIKEINKKYNTTIVIVEQNSKLALSISNRGYVMNLGEIAMSDNSENLLKNNEVKKLYLGEK